MPFLAKNTNFVRSRILSVALLIALFCPSLVVNVAEAQLAGIDDYAQAIASGILASASTRRARRPARISS